MDPIREKEEEEIYLCKGQFYNMVDIIFLLRPCPSTRYSRRSTSEHIHRLHAMQFDISIIGLDTTDYMASIGSILHTIKLDSMSEAIVALMEEERGRNHASCKGTRWARYFASKFQFCIGKGREMQDPKEQQCTGQSLTMIMQQMQKRRILLQGCE